MVLKRSIHVQGASTGGSFSFPSLPQFDRRDLGRSGQLRVSPSASSRRETTEGRQIIPVPAGRMQSHKIIDLGGLRILTNRGDQVTQRIPIVPAVIPKVRSRPVPLPGAGLLPSQQPLRGAEMPTFLENLGDVAVGYARQEFLGTGQATPGTVIEFPTTYGGLPVAAPQIAATPQYAKKRRRRRRLLTASDKCDIAAMKAMLNTAEFKIWLACPSMFKG